MSRAMRGYSLIEMMISVTLASLLFAAAASVFFQQSHHIERETVREIAVHECHSTFDKLGRLLRQAQLDTIDIQYGSGKSNTEPESANDSIQITFALPESYSIWPNDVAPFDRNWVRVAWTNGASPNPYGITIANAVSESALSNAPTISFAGNTNDESNARISNFDLDRQEVTDKIHSAGYVLRVSARSDRADATYTNPDLPKESPLRHFRTCTTSGVVSPRN